MSAQGGWCTYLGIVFSMMVLVIFVPTVLLGTIYPYLLKTLEAYGQAPGKTAGQLAGVNTIGAVAGSLLASFVLLETLGLWWSIRACALGYCLLALVVSVSTKKRAARDLLPAAALLFGLLLLPASVPLTVFSAGQHLEAVYEGSAGIVSVVRTGEVIDLRVDNHLVLGSTSPNLLRAHQMLGELPLILHPSAKKVFFLGLGTCIPAASALKFPIDSLTACEIVPGVVRASREHFAHYIGTLHTDPRAEIVIEDGRNFLLGTKEKYDLIISELFFPWQAGSGQLYSIEHFRTGAERLEEHGLFVQWIPAGQFTEPEFASVAATMLEVFPELTLWEPLPGFHSWLALVGSKKGLRLGAEQIEAAARVWQADGVGPGEVRAAFLARYLGNVSGYRQALSSATLNTDDKPNLEYSAPISQLSVLAGQKSYISAEKLRELSQQLQRLTPPDKDPVISQILAASHAG